jgi:hypothetical protein
MGISNVYDRKSANPDHKEHAPEKRVCVHHKKYLQRPPYRCSRSVQMYAVAAHAESRLIAASMYSPGLVPSEQFTSRTVAQSTSEEVTAALVHCFQGYLVPMRLTAERYEMRSRAENQDPFASKIYYSKGAPAAVAMIARRGWTSRLQPWQLLPIFAGAD